MTEFNDLRELLEAVLAHRLEPGETLIPVCGDPLGKTLGYATADGKGPTERWLIGREVVRAGGRRSRAARDLAAAFTSHQGRRALIDDLRSGAVKLGKLDVVNEVPPPPVVVEPVKPKQLRFPGM